MRTVVVDRKTWYRGKGEENSKLLNHEGQRCCLGFDAACRGIPDADILGLGAPPEVCNINPKYAELYPDFVRTMKNVKGFVNTDLVYCFYLVNDSSETDDNFKEDRLKQLGESVGIDFQFIN